MQVGLVGPVGPAGPVGPVGLVGPVGHFMYHAFAVLFIGILRSLFK